MPFATRAIVVLPDHLHAVWTLPEGGSDFSTLWKRIKRDFTVGIGETRPGSASKQPNGEAGLWQRRFWEQLVRGDAELSGVQRYICGNPVKHGLTQRAVDWPFSSIHREIRAGRLPVWGI